MKSTAYSCNVPFWSLDLGEIKMSDYIGGAMNDRWSPFENENCRLRIFSGFHGLCWSKSSHMNLSTCWLKRKTLSSERSHSILHVYFSVLTFSQHPRWLQIANLSHDCAFLQKILKVLTLSLSKRLTPACRSTNISRMCPVRSAVSRMSRSKRLWWITFWFWLWILP